MKRPPDLVLARAAEGAFEGGKSNRGPLELRIETADPTHLQISRQVERLILTGELEAGERLPSNSVLARRWGVSCSSVQKAMHRLCAAGRLERTPGRGTFVKPLTHQAVIGLLFGPDLSVEPSHFYRAMDRALEAELPARRWTPRIYDGWFLKGGARPAPDAPVTRRLEEDLHHHVFSGLIELQLPHRFNVAAEERASLPTATWGGAEPDALLDEEEFFTQTLRHLATRGRRRVALGSFSPQRATAQMEAFRRAAAGCGIIPFEPLPVLLGDHENDGEREVFEFARCMLRDWFRKPSGAAPDALVVEDDIMMRAVALAMAHEQVSAPERLMVACQTNDAFELHYGIPVVRYEFSVREVARVLLDLLWKRMTNAPLPDLPVRIGGRIREDP